MPSVDGLPGWSMGGPRQCEERTEPRKVQISYWFENCGRVAGHQHGLQVDPDATHLPQRCTGPLSNKSSGKRTKSSEDGEQPNVHIEQPTQIDNVVKAGIHQVPSRQKQTTPLK